MNCQQATRLISLAQDRRLSVLESVQLKTHTLMCSGCRNFGLQVPFLREAMRAYAVRQQDDGDAHEEGGPSSSSGPTVPPPTSS